MNAALTPERPARTVTLFVILFAIGSIYVASLAYFLVHGTNFINKQKIISATLFSKSETLTLPVTLHFTKQSKWSHALATGWNVPENWGVWSSLSRSVIVLPEILNTPHDVFISVRVGAMGSTLHWPIKVIVNGHALAPQERFSGAGPFVVDGITPISAGKLIHLEFLGPAPRIPNIVSSGTTDARSLGLSLFQISITAQCAPPSSEAKPGN